MVIPLFQNPVEEWSQQTLAKPDLHIFHGGARHILWYQGGVGIQIFAQWKFRLCLNCELLFTRLNLTLMGVNIYQEFITSTTLQALTKCTLNQPEMC